MIILKEKKIHKILRMFSNETAHLIDQINNAYIFYFDIFLLICGLVSNLLIIYIFAKLSIFRRNRSAYYLKTESITNIGLLLGLLPSNIVGYVLGENPARLSVVWCKIQLMCTYAFGLYSLCTICFLSIDQYLSTNHRQNWRQMNTIQLAHRLTIFAVCFAVFHAILFLIFADIGAFGCSIYHPIAKMYFSFFFYPILGGLLPFVISIVFSLLAYQNVRRIIRRQISLVRRRLDQQMTAIALTRVVNLVVFGLPFLVYSLIELNINVGKDEVVKKAILNLTFSIVSSLLYANFAVSKLIIE